MAKKKPAPKGGDLPKGRRYDKLPEALQVAALAYVRAWTGVVPRALHESILSQLGWWHDYVKNDRQKKSPAGEVYTCIQQLDDEVILACTPAVVKKLKLSHIVKMRSDCLSS